VTTQLYESPPGPTRPSTATLPSIYANEAPSLEATKDQPIEMYYKQMTMMHRVEMAVDALKLIREFCPISPSDRYV